MKKLITALTIIAMLTTALTGCSQGNDTNEKDTTSAEAEKNSGVEQLVNDKPITTEAEELAPLLEYINQYVYTSDFEAINKYEFWVYEPNAQRPKVELSDKMKIDDTLTLKLGDDLTEFSKTEYYDYREYNENVNAVYCSKEKYGPDYFSLYLNDTTDEEIELQYRTIEHITMNPAAEYDYLGITTGDSLEKVIQTIGSPNKEIRFEVPDGKEGDMFMCYTDSDKKLTLQIKIELDLNNAENPATVYSLSLYDYDLEEHDTDH